MNYIKNFQKAHDEATSQNVKDWLLIKAVIREVAIGLFRSLIYLFFYPVVVMAIGLCEIVKEMFYAIIAWPVNIWKEGLARAWRGVKALKYIRKDTLPVNVKIVRNSK